MVPSSLSGSVLAEPDNKRSQLGPHVPQFGEQLDLEHLAQIGDALSPAGAALEPDHALDRGDVVEPPAPEIILEVDQLLGELVRRPMLLGRQIYPAPGSLHLGALRTLLRETAALVADTDPRPAEQPDRLAAQARPRQAPQQLADERRAVRVRLEHRGIAVAAQ